ncbi:hypothetical protein [Anaerostipes sp.]|nr:hypothetical protein [Anaerostipes sp.]
MKKKWMRGLAAVSLIVTMGAGTGTVLQAQEEIAGKTGGGYF